MDKKLNFNFQNFGRKAQSLGFVFSLSFSLLFFGLFLKSFFSPSSQNVGSSRVLGQATHGSPSAAQESNSSPTHSISPSLQVTDRRVSETVLSAISQTTVTVGVFPTPAPSSGSDSIPLPVVETPAPTATPIPTQVSLKIIPPEGTDQFSLDYRTGEDACHLLERARDEGRLRSVTIDYSYLKTFRSAYVVEINGYRDNWTFTANGASPLGCSLYQIQENDAIVWKFL